MVSTTPYLLLAPPLPLTPDPLTLLNLRAMETLYIYTFRVHGFCMYGVLRPGYIIFRLVYLLTVQGLNCQIFSVLPNFHVVVDSILKNIR